MAAAKKCDRCGALYDIFNKDDCVPTMTINGGESNVYIMASYRQTVVDLCPKCSKAFNKFLNNKDWRA